MEYKIKNKGKVAIFHCGFIYSGGGERIVLEEARGLKKRGWDVEVYAPTLNAKKCYPEMVKEVGVKMFLPSFIDWLPFRNGLRMIASSVLAPILAIKFTDVDIFIGANQPGAWIAYCVSKVLGKPYIVYHNQPNRLLFPRPVDKNFGWFTTEKDYQILYYLIKFIQPLITFTDHLSVVNGKVLLANGAYISGILENVYGIKAIDAPAGAYYQAKNKLLIGSDMVFKGVVKLANHKIPKPYFLITNRHDPQKRFDFVIRAFKLVIGKFPKAFVVIPGPFTQHTQQLLEITKNLGLEKHVLFLGQIPEADLQKLYRQAAVNCYPSPEEDFGLGPLEAGGWGVPTVAWKHGGPTVTVEHGKTGYLAKPYDISDYARGMYKLITDPNLRHRLGKSAWQRTKNIFSWDRHVNIVERELELALNGAPRTDIRGTS